jgi:protein ImuB
MLWLCAQLPDLGLEVFSRGVDAQAHAPLVLVEDNRVVLRNKAASEAEIGLGTTLATAHSIRHGVRHFVRDREIEQERLRLLAEACYRYGPSISPHEPDALLLEVGPSLRLFNGLYGLKRNLIQLLADSGHEARIGVASTPLAALAFARAGFAGALGGWPTADELDTHTHAGLKEVPLRHAELTDSVRERFANMGIVRLGVVLGLPKAELGRRFGTSLLHYLERLTGKRGDPRSFIAPRETFTSQLHLLEGISNKQALAFPMQRLAGELNNWLISHQLGANTLRWRFAPLRGTSVSLDIEFAEPQQGRPALLEISRLKLDASTLPEEVMSIVLEAPRLTSWQGRSRSLFPLASLPFSQANGNSAPPPGELIDRFKARLGADVCHGIQISDDHRPERAWTRIAPGSPPGSKGSQTRLALAASARGDSSNTSARGDSGAKARRPLWLLKRPRPVPRRELTLLAGPERIETGWWDAPAPRSDRPGPKRRCRDYYIAHRITPKGTGMQCWVYADALRQRWFIHGYFS